MAVRSPNPSNGRNFIVFFCIVMDRPGYHYPTGYCYDCSAHISLIVKIQTRRDGNRAGRFPGFVDVARTRYVISSATLHPHTVRPHLQIHMIQDFDQSNRRLRLGTMS